MRDAIKSGSIAFTILLGAIAALPPLSIDLNLPALPLIALSLGGSPQGATATLSTFMAGFALAQLIYGPLSDRFGRRPVLLFGLILYGVAGFACATASSMEGLIVWRAMQGAGAGAGMVLARAMVRDTFDDPSEARAQFSYLNMIMQVAPVVAPPLGGVILIGSSGSWRLIFAGLGFAGAALLVTCWLRLGETVGAHRQSSIRLGVVLANYKTFLGLRPCLGNSLLVGAAFGCAFAFISGSPLVFVSHFAMSAIAYAGVFAAVSLCIIAGSFGLGVGERAGLDSGTLVRASLVVSCLSTAAACPSLALSGPAAPVLLTVALGVMAFSFGVIMPVATQGALQPVPDMAGIGAAVLGFLHMLGGALSSLIVGLLFQRFGPVAMPATMLAFALVALGVYETLVRPGPAAAANTAVTEPL